MDLKEFVLMAQFVHEDQSMELRYRTQVGSLSAVCSVLLAFATPPNGPKKSSFCVLLLVSKTQTTVCPNLLRT